MSQRIYALLAVMAICSIYVFILTLLNNTGVPDASVYALGSVFGLFAFTAVFATIVGFVGGAVKAGGFRPTFFWAAIIFAPTTTALAHLGSVS